jgi:hypothetical protein
VFVGADGRITNATARTAMMAPTMRRAGSTQGARFLTGWAVG